MNLTSASLENRSEWESKGYRLPSFDIPAMQRLTKSAPTWVHFGAGNIFKAFLADSCQHLLDEGLTDTGIIAVDRHPKGSAGETSDSNLTVKVTLKADGTAEKAVIASIAEHLYLYEDEPRLQEVFRQPSLQMVSFTITEKGYTFSSEPVSLSEAKESYMGRITALLHARYEATAAPLAMVSMDNCSHNGDKLKAVILHFAAAWNEPAFEEWLNNKVAFPSTMIDKITPGPDRAVAAMLEADGLAAGTPFVNAEESEYLVVEDHFPNGRPQLEKSGIYFTTREVVDKSERMKVCTCLNPLHTSLAVFGCLLGYDRVWKEMQDEDLHKLVELVGYKEGLPVVTDPGIISPREFIDTVVNVRIPNPFLPDMPQRIATDTSQKLPIRFGETLKSYLASDTLNVDDLKAIPLVFAGWLRYLVKVDDEGKAFTPSPDPLLEKAAAFVAANDLKTLLSDSSIFGVDLCEAGLADKVCAYFAQMMEGPGSVRRTLHETVK